MTVDALMTRDLITTTPGTSLSEISTLLREHGVRHLLVVDENNTLCGVISDRDVLRVTSPFLDTYTEEPRDVKTLSLPAGEIMRDDPIVIRPSTAVEEAAQLFLKHSISSLPVVDEGALVGIVTTKDLLQHYAEGG